MSPSWLEPFAAPEAAGLADRPGRPPEVARIAREELFRGREWLAGMQREVVCSLGRDHYRLECRPSRPLLIERAGGRITVEPGQWAATDPAELEILFGAALLLALAEGGTFALHASAVATPHGTVAFVGESGAGKSTIAEPAGDSWQRIADDIVPFRLVDDVPMAFPRYPQLKLPADAQYPRSSPDAVRLAAVYEIDVSTAAEVVSVEPLTPRDGALRLIAHTVAARLFPHDLLEAHLEVCARAATTVRVVRLRVPRRFQELPAGRGAVFAHLASLGS